MSRIQSVYAVAVPCLAVAVYLVYAPGLGGTFLLDDSTNLREIGQVGDPASVDGILRYLFAHGAGYLTRPLAKLSFLVDATTWPAPPQAFKRTNIGLHIINGLLVIALVLRLTRHLGHRETVCAAVALCTGALWLLHPLNVSTTLYVVQRMTILATFFMLLGMIAYASGRTSLAERPVRGYLMVTAGTGLGALFGFLCKEIGALLPVYLLVLETCLYRTLPAPRGWRVWKTAFLVGPLVLSVGWLLYTYLPEQAYASRSFDLSERVLTQARALVDYLRLILIPTRTGTGVFHDDFAVSRSLLDPVTTLLSVLALTGLLASAMAWRKRMPVYALGVLWFFAGHLLESSVIPLEIYFEHRNYLPMLGPVFAVVYSVATAEVRLKGFLRAGLAAYVALAALATWQNTVIWGDQALAPTTWEREHPDSVRALQYARNFWLRVGRYDEAAERREHIALLQPTWTAPKLERLLDACRSGHPPSQALVETVAAEVGGSDWDSATDKVLDALFRQVLDAPCDTVDLDTLLELTDRLIANPAFQRRSPTMAGLYIQKFLIHKQRGELRKQVEALREAYEWNKSWHIAMQESIIWAALGENEKALEALARAKQHYKVDLKQLSFEYDSSEISQWENYLKGRRTGIESDAQGNTRP